MRKLTALLLALLLTATIGMTCAALAAQAADTAGKAEAPSPMVVYSPYQPRPIAALLPGFPTEITMTDGAWTGILFPADAQGSDLGRVKAGAVLSQAMDDSHWPEAEVIADDASFNSVDLNLYYCTLSRGDKVKIAGRCNGAWYVLADLPNGLQFGAMDLDSLAVDPETTALLQSVLAEYPATGAALDELYDQWEHEGAQLIARYGFNKGRWPQAERAAYDELQWSVGFYWEMEYAVQPTKADLTEIAALMAVRRYLAQKLPDADPDALAMNAQFLRAQGADDALWHVFLHLTDGSSAVFTVNGAAGMTMEDIRVSISQDDLLRVCEMLSLPMDEGMMDVAAARELAWLYAAQELNVADRGSYMLRIEYYTPGAMAHYDWADEDWCSTRPVFRANFYTDGQVMEIGEIWFDAESGEIYRMATESSSLG